MTDLTERQKLILALVVRDYIETALPVSSNRLVEAYGLEVSSATVRNEMVALSDMGLLRQLHTSAGRVPTEEGYRYFVRQLMVQTELPLPTQHMITHQFYQAGGDVEQWLRLAASVLAKQSLGAALVTAPLVAQILFKHLELITTHGRQVLMVLILGGGDVRQQMLLLAEPVPQARLSSVAARITELCRGLDADAIQALTTSLDALEQDIVKLVLEEMRRSKTLISGEVYRDGLTNVLAEPEFAEVETARRALRILEERPLLDDLISRTLVSTKPGGVEVLIGGEDTWTELRECSVVLARYGVPDQITGTVGVLGPIRMPYGRTISAVRFVAGVLSELVSDRFSEE